MPAPVWIDAIAFDTSKNPPERTPAREPVQVQTSAPVALPSPASTGAPSLADLIATVIAVRGAFDAVRAASPHFWTFETHWRSRELDRFELPAGECRWHDLGKSSAWEPVDGVRVPFVWHLAVATQVPGLPELMLALRELRRIAYRCPDADPEQAMFALRAARLSGRQYAAGPLEVVDGNCVRLPVEYPAQQLEALDAWAETAAKGYTLNDNQRRVLRALLREPLPFVLLAEALNADNKTLTRWLHALEGERLVAGGDGEHWKLTPLGRAVIGSG